MEYNRQSYRRRIQYVSAIERKYLTCVKVCKTCGNFHLMKFAKLSLKISGTFLKSLVLSYELSLRDEISW